MNRQEIRENALDQLRNELGLIDVISWYDRRFMQGFTDVLVRVIPERCSRYFRVFDGGLVEEIQPVKLWVEWAENESVMGEYHGR